MIIKYFLMLSASSVCIQHPLDSTERQSCHCPDPVAPRIPIFKALSMYRDISLMPATDTKKISETYDV